MFLGKHRVFHHCSQCELIRDKVFALEVTKILLCVRLEISPSIVIAAIQPAVGSEMTKASSHTSTVSFFLFFQAAARDCQNVLPFFL